MGIAHTGLLTQNFGGANACAHTPQGVGFQNGMSCTTDVVIGDAANETRHINACGASRLAGRVKAVITAVCFNLGLRKIQRGMGVAKILRVLRRRQSSRDYARCEGLGCHTLFFQKITVV